MMPTRHRKRCSTPIGPRVTLCEACRVENADRAWRQQGAERRSAYQEIDIDAIPRIVGCRERDEWTWGCRLVITPSLFM